MSSVFLFGHGMFLEYFSCLIAFFALFLIMSFGNGGLGRLTRLLLFGFGFGFFYSHTLLIAVPFLYGIFIECPGACSYFNLLMAFLDFLLANFPGFM